MKYVPRQATRQMQATWVGSWFLSWYRSSPALAA